MLPDQSTPAPVPTPAPQPTAPVTPPSNNFFSTLLSDKKRLGLVVSVVGLVIIGGISLVFLTQRVSKDPTGQGPKTSAPQSIESLINKQYSKSTDGIYYQSAVSPALKNPPKVEFNFVNQSTAPTLPESADVYRLNHDLAEFQATELAKKFNISGKAKLIGVGNYHYIDTNTKTDLVVFKRSGGFIATFGNNLLASPSATSIKVQNNTQAIDQAKAYLQSINLWEDLFTAKMGDKFPQNPTVYRRQSQPNIYFVEFHRGWVPIPILNQVGLLNSPLKDQLADPKQYLERDLDITSASDGLALYQRPDQFNTLTVGINLEGNPTYLQYYLRTIAQKQTVKIKPYTQAVDELKSGKGLGMLVYPVAQRAAAGQEVKEYSDQQWGQLFLGNKAISKEAVIDDVQLAYEEKFITESQSVMSPMYIFRGRAPLDSGVVVNFVALIDARGN